MRKSIYRSIKFIMEHSKKYFLINIFYKIIQGIIPTVYVLCLQRAINSLQNEVSFKYIMICILVYVGLQGLNKILQLLYSQYIYNFNLMFTADVNVKMMEKATRLSLKDYENVETYNIINRAQGQTGANIINYINSLLEITQQIISIMSMCYILFQYTWLIFIIIIIVPVIRSVVTYVLDKEIYNTRVARTEKERQKWYINFLVTTGTAYKEIKLLGIGKFLISKYIRLQSNIIDDEKKYCKKNTWINMGMDITETILSSGIYIYTFFQGFLGKILIGDVTAYLESINTIKSSIGGIFMEINNLVEQSLYVNLLFEYLDMPELKELKEKNIEDIKKIEFRNVSYKYMNNTYGVKNIDLVFETGTTIALIGENGSGKTTLLKLMLGLYDEYEGDIYVNGINLRDINKSSYQCKIGVVFQDYLKYETSIRENIGYGDLEQIDNNEKIMKLIKKVHLDKKVNSFDGIDIIVGNWFGKQQFSIGEWQRIAIARALIRDADIYIFDEPDASLDVFRQREIVNVIKEAANEKIGIYVSHKINYVNEVADKIIVLENGVITEKGTHRELLKKRGKYFQLYEVSTR